MRTAPSEARKKRWYRNGWFKLFAACLICVVLLLLFRIRILHAAGTFLIRTDAQCQADALYVLGGAAFDRGSYTQGLLAKGCAPIAYCTGSTISQSYKAEGRMLTEADLTRAAAVRGGADPQQVLPFPYGTSTWEEAAGILHHAKAKGYKTILLLTTDFHSRRVGKVFREQFAGSGIAVAVQAAPSSEYDVNAWWNSEQGLLMVNNEYVKTLYYLLKH